VTRLLTKLRGHGLITKVKHSRLYRLSEKGMHLLAAAVHYRQVEFPNALVSAAA
jgi:DNA-binding PadR family transcriptional regulator